MLTNIAFRKKPLAAVVAATVVGLPPLLTGCAPGMDQPAVKDSPLSSMVAVRLDNPKVAAGALMVSPENATNIPDYVKALVDEYATTGFTPLGGEFPLPNAYTDTVRTIPGLASNVVASWLDPLTPVPNGPRYGANNDYIAYFGEGWDKDWDGDMVGSAPQFNGSAKSGWIWSNHEYISNGEPEVGVAPSGQHLVLAQFLADQGVLGFDVTVDGNWNQAAVDTYVNYHKKQLGGSWFKVVQGLDGEWRIDFRSNNKRYDSTDSTLLRLTGYTLTEQDHLDDGSPVPATNVVVGITADCSGGTTPWGTILSAEENAQSQWGDFETGWSGVSSDRQFNPTNGVWGAGQTFDFGSPAFASTLAASTSSLFGMHSDPNTRHNREVYGFLAEVDPGKDADQYYVSGTDGEGHRKIGSMGRARWENAAIVTDMDFELNDNQPVVIYGANDRRGGRVYKWVSEGNYQEGMTKAEVRALVDEGTLYVAHFEDLDVRTGWTPYAANNGDAGCDAAIATDDEAEIAANCDLFTETSPGTGTWIELSLSNNAQTAPNAGTSFTVPASIDATTPTYTQAGGVSVGAALQDDDWNGIGGFASDNQVLAALFTAAAKVGVTELNRPEDVEWNPVDQKLYIAFTYHQRTYGLTQAGTLNFTSDSRVDNVGSIFALVEDNQANPGSSGGFEYYPVWNGSNGQGPFDVARPDNMMIDRDGGVWFGTDGNPSPNDTNDALYYLDLDPAHKTSPVMTYGKAFRVISGPSDSEATGPALNSDMSTVFFNVQHPGENQPSDWPHNQL